MKTAVISAGGFIAKHFIESAQNASIRIDLYSRPEARGILNQSFPNVPCFAVDTSAFWERAPEYRSIIYLRSETGPSQLGGVTKELEANVNTASRFFTKLGEVNPNCHIIFPSSGGTVYGAGYTDPIPETSSPNPKTLYGLGKILIEHVLKHLAAAHGQPVTILRISNPVGYWQLGGRHGFVAAAIRSALSERPLTVFGAGTNKRDYFDVDDLATLLCKISLEPAYGFQLFNIGSGVATTEQEVICTVERALNLRLHPTFTARRSTDLDYAVVDPNQAFEKLSWTTERSLYDTILKVAARIKREGLPEQTVLQPRRSADFMDPGFDVDSD